MNKTNLTAILSAAASTFSFMAHGELPWEGTKIICPKMGLESRGIWAPEGEKIASYFTKENAGEFLKTFSYVDPIQNLIPNTNDALVSEILAVTQALPPFLINLVCNCSIGTAKTLQPTIEAMFFDQNPDQRPEKRTTPINFINLRTEDLPFTASDNALHNLNKQGYANVTIAVYAHNKCFNGGLNDKVSMFNSNTAQEEQTVRCFPGLFSRVNETGCVKQIIGNYEEFDLAKAKENLCFPRYRYWFGETAKQLAPDFTLSTDKEGYLRFKSKDSKFSTFSTFAVNHAQMHYVSTTDKLTNILDKRGNPTPGCLHLDTPIEANLVYTAAPELVRNKLPVNTYLSVDYFSTLVEDFKVQMADLNDNGTETFVTGPAGCGIFGNDESIVALTYAYVFMYYTTEVLKNVAITAVSFYTQLEKAWGIVDNVVPIAGESENEFLKRIFQTAFPTPIQLNAGQNAFSSEKKKAFPLCTAGTPLAEAFDSTLAAPDRKLHVSKEKFEELKALEGFDTCVNRAGQFLSELIVVAE